MKKIVLVCGLIAGLIVTLMMAISTAICYRSGDFEGNMVLGYATMLIAFSMIFVGIKTYRDKYNNGLISFRRAFRIGLYISLIASTLYVIVWLFEYYFFMPDFLEKYIAHVIQANKADGASPAELDKQVKEMSTYKEMYKNPLLIALITYAEILPVGIIVTLISALILKRKATSQVQPV